MSTTPSIPSTTARAVRVVCLTPSRAPGCSGRSLIQQTVASSSRAATGWSSGSTSMSPRGTSISSSSRIVTDIPGTAASIGPSAVSTDATRVRSPDGSTSTSSPARQTPPATWPA